MPRKPRGKFKVKGYYHVYNRGNRKQRIFRNRQDRKVFMGLLLRVISENNDGTELSAHCLMDNHYHLVFRQGFEVQISKIMQRVLTSYVKYFNHKYNLVGHVFQGRYQSRYIPNKYALKNLMKYLRENPVKARYVKNPDHYAWLFTPDDLGTDIPRDRPL